MIQVVLGSVAVLVFLAGCSPGTLTKDGMRSHAQRDRKGALAASTQQPAELNATAEAGPRETVPVATFQGTIQSLHPERRQVTVRLNDGKVVRVSVAQGNDDFTTLKSGNRVAFKLREAVGISQDLSFHSETGHIVERFPPGSMAERELYSSYYHRPPTGHHAVNWSGIIELPAKVVAVDANSRAIRLITYDGRKFTVHVSDPRTDLTRLKSGEPIVAHFMQVDELQVIHSR